MTSHLVTVDGEIDCEQASIVVADQAFKFWSSEFLNCAPVLSVYGKELFDGQPDQAGGG